MPTHRSVQPGVETKKTYCRFCHNYCAMEVDVLDGKPIAVRGDTSDPVYGGYTCLKGRQLVAAYDHESRITRPLKKLADGSWQEISSKQALDEIAEKVKNTITAEGPRSIATYCGTYSFQESAALALSRAFHEGIKSPSISKIWLRVAATTRPSREFTVSSGADTLQHSVGLSSTKTLHLVFCATRFLLWLCAMAPDATSELTQSSAAKVVLIPICPASRLS